jgi:hypothetical protein
MVMYTSSHVAVLSKIIHFCEHFSDHVFWSAFYTYCTNVLRSPRRHRKVVVYCFLCAARGAPQRSFLNMFLAYSHQYSIDVELTRTSVLTRILITLVKG